MIYSCYQGCGKSTLGKELGFVDLESSCFKINNQRADNWFITYAKIAKNLSDEGKTVFVSSHKILRQYMMEQNIPFVSVYPSKNLKDFWINKLCDRFLADSSNKNYIAFADARQSFEKEIEDMSQDSYTIEINSEEYDLKKLLRSFELTLQ